MRLPPARGGGGAGRDGAVWGKWERGRRETVGLGWFFLNVIIFQFPGAAAVAALAGSRVSGRGRGAPCHGRGPAVPGAVPLPVRGVRRVAGGDERRRPAAEQRQWLDRAAVAGQGAVAALLASLPAPLPGRAAGVGLAAPLLPGSSERGAALGEGGRSPLSAPGPRLPPAPPPRSPRRARAAGLGAPAGAALPRGVRQPGHPAGDGRAAMSVCPSVCLSLAVTARPGSEAPLGPLEKWE